MDAQTLTYPSETIQCVPGDYIMTKTEEGAWRVLFVKDLVLLSRLIPLTFPQGIELLEERHMAESQAPAYFREIYLLLADFQGLFSNRNEAIKAVDAGALGNPLRTLCSPIRQFPRTDAFVHTRSRDNDAKTPKD